MDYTRLTDEILIIEIGNILMVAYINQVKFNCMKLLPTIDKIKDIKILENLGVEIEFDPQEEDMQPDFDNEEMEQEVARKYENGNMAAWFCAHVIARYKGFEGDDYLGCCSYNSFKEFTTQEGYYTDMINQSVEQINSDIDRNNKDIQKRWNIRKAKNLIAPYGLHIVYSNVLTTV